ncbi:MAG: hypothetical protein QGG48_13285, partial [Desulfatiglandales bacterium]|nr:hypothetical protein [Desulfatiglandales bacterium]
VAIPRTAAFSRKAFHMMRCALNIAYTNSQEVLSANPIRFMFQNGMDPATHYLKSTEQPSSIRRGVLMRLIKINSCVMPDLIRHPENLSSFFLDSDFYPPLADLPE